MEEIYRYTEYKKHRKFNEGSNKLLNLVMKLPLSEPINDVRDWINAEEQQDITDVKIVNIANKENKSIEDDEVSEDEDRRRKISQTDELKFIESTIEYTEQQ